MVHRRGRRAIYNRISSVCGIWTRFLWCPYRDWSKEMLNNNEIEDRDYYDDYDDEARLDDLEWEIALEQDEEDY